MALSKTTAGSGTGAFSGTILFQGFVHDGGADINLVASISGPGGSVGYSMWSWLDNSGQYPQNHVYLRGTSACGMGGTNGDEELGITTFYEFPVPYSEYVGATSATKNASGSESSMNLWKSRAVGTLPDPISAITHPQFFETGYAWGSDSYDQACSSGLSTDSATALSLPPVWVPGAIATTFDRVPLTVTVGVNDGYGAPPSSADVVIVSNVTYCGQAVDFSGISETSNGMTVTGSGSTLTLTVDNWAAVSAHTFSFTVWAYIGVAYDLKCYDWDGAEVEGNCFRIAQADGSGTQDVPSGYSETVIYTQNSWDATKQRISYVAPILSPDWLAAHNEIVDPSDALCIIEEGGLTHPVAADYQWEGLAVRRRTADSVQFPFDATDWPSTWGTVSTGLAVVNNAGPPWKTTVTVGAGASNGAIVRTLNHDDSDWLLSKDVGNGVATLGLRDAYQVWHHAPPSTYGAPATGADVWCWRQYSVVKLSYDSDRAATLTLEVEYSTLAVYDPSVTGSTRVTDTTFTWTEGLTLTKTLAVVAGTGLNLYTHLAAAGDVRLMRVDKLTVTGFTGSGADWSFVINDLAPVPATPDGTGTGSTRITHTCPRVDSSGLPIHYDWLRLVCDGQRGFDVPDQKVCLLDDYGLIGVNYLRGVESGVVMDGMLGLSSYFYNIGRCEGMVVDGISDFTAPPSPLPCENGHATYDADFVDADANDMLDGGLYTGDLCEQADLAINDSDETFTVLPARPRCGKLWLASGTTISCVVRERRHGNLHGVARSGGVTVANAEITLFERTTGGGGETSLGSEQTDAWGRWSRKGKSGYRENCEGGVSCTGLAADVAAWYSTRNKLRRWIGAVPVLVGYPTVEHNKVFGAVYLCYESGGNIVYRHWSPGTGWSDAETAVTGATRPSLARKHNEPAQDLFYLDGGNIKGAEQVAWTNSWGDPKTLSTTSAFAARAGNMDLATLCYSGGNFLFQRYDRLSKIAKGDPVTVAAGSNATPALLQDPSSWHWWCAIPTASGVQVYESDSVGSAWTLRQTFAGTTTPALACSETALELAYVEGTAIKWRQLTPTGALMADPVTVATVSPSGMALTNVLPVGKRMLLAGTGTGIGVYESDDAGTTWTLTETLT